MRPQSRLLITADDAACSVSIDRAIFELAELGILTGVSAFSTHGRLRALGKQLRGNVPLGIHFNLSSGSPLSEVSTIPSLVNSNGEFHSPTPRTKSSMMDSLELYLRRRVRLFASADIRLELSRQLAAFEDTLGSRPAFATVHHDLDRVNSLRRIIASLFPDLPCRQARLKAGLLEGVFCTFLKEHDSDRSASDIIASMLLAAKGRIINRMGCSVEVVCHPGYASKDLRFFTVYIAQRELELRAWGSTKVRCIFRDGVKTPSAWLFDAVRACS